MKLLIVEDEEALVLALRDRLVAEGYEVAWGADGAAGLERATRERFDAIVLDVMLPGRSGFEVCRELRSAGVQTPVLMLTARGQLDDKLLGFKLGADDYLTKPFEVPELVARLEALLRRGQRAAASARSFRFGSLELDVEAGEVRRGGVPVALSAKEFDLLVYFAEHPGVVLSRERLLDEVWGYDATTCTRTVDVHVSWLRQKIEDEPGPPSRIVTVHRRGYKFVP
jgi:two-component system alkaline phosphatase synthesis response regulator PhoP